MCHLVLLMPVIALPVFWLMPLTLATPLYAAIALISGLVYWLITKAMVKPIKTGAESMVGTTAKVVSRFGINHNSKYLVRAGGELWTARSDTKLQPGEHVNVAAVEGISLIVKSGDTNVAEVREITGKTDERHCH